MLFFLVSASRESAFLTHFLDSILVGSIIASHIEKCRTLPFLRNSLAVIIPEANMATIAQHIMISMRQLHVPNCVFMTEDNDRAAAHQYDLPGSITTRRNKPEMVTLLIEDYMKKQRLVFFRDFVVAEPESSVVDDVKGEFVKQMRSFLRRKKAVKQRDGSVLFETFYTGKHNGGTDDFVLTLMIGVFMQRRFFTSEKYRMYYHGCTVT